MFCGTTGLGDTTADRLEAVNLAQRIYDQHQWLKTLAQKGLLTKGMVERASEFARYMQVIVERYGEGTKPHVLANWKSVIDETPRLKAGLGILPLLIFGFALIAGLVTASIVSAVKKNLDVQEREIQLQMVKAGYDPSKIKQPAGFLGDIKGIVTALTIAGVMFALFKFLPKGKAA